MIFRVFILYFSSRGFLGLYFIYIKGILKNIIMFFGGDSCFLIIACVMCFEVFWFYIFGCYKDNLGF